MADNRKYYYLKLKESYFDDDAIVLLESMPDGILYSNILLKLYLKSLKNGGKLQLDENIPYTAQMIATLTRQQVGTVERALGIFQQLGLVEQLHGGLLYMTDIELMIGQSSTEAERKRAARLANKALPPPRTNGGHLSDIRPPEIEIKKEIDTPPPEALLFEKLFQIFLRCGDGSNAEILYEVVQHIGRNERRQRGTKANILDPQMQQRQQNAHCLLLIPREHQRQRQVVDPAAERLR